MIFNPLIGSISLLQTPFLPQSLDPILLLSDPPELPQYFLCHVPHAHLFSNIFKIGTKMTPLVNESHSHNQQQIVIVPGPL